MKLRDGTTIFCVIYRLTQGKDPGDYFLEYTANVGGCMSEWQIMGVTTGNHLKKVKFESPDPVTGAVTVMRLLMWIRAGTGIRGG
jgi:hypothetical protein